MASEHWARLRMDNACGLRLGAWYRVARVESGSVVIAVGGDEIHVPREALEVVEIRPELWSVVDRRVGSISLLARWGACYAVCPSCRQRQVPIGRPRTQRCNRCNEAFEVAWDEPIIAGYSRT